MSLSYCVSNRGMSVAQEFVLRVFTGADFDGRSGALSPTEAALRAADLFDGRAGYQRLLLRHVLFVTGAALPYFQAARALSTEQRADVEAGRVSLCHFVQSRGRANVIDISA